jgi:hypothetical protein
MVSSDAVVAVEMPSEEPQKPPCTRTRRDWARGEVRCLMCERLIGSVLGSRNRGASGDRSSGNRLVFFAYRSADTSQRVAAFRPGMGFRCGGCGGTGALAEVEFFSTFDELPLSAEGNEPLRRGPGRPPRPMNRTEPAPRGLALCPTARAGQA